MLRFFLPIAAAVCALVNPGNFGMIDTTHRLEVSRWLRLTQLARWAIAAWTALATCLPVLVWLVLRRVQLIAARRA